MTGPVDTPDPEESRIPRTEPEPDALDAELAIPEFVLEDMEHSQELPVVGDDIVEAPAETEQTTEWFSIEDEFEAPALPRRHHHVTAVLVAHNGEPWLPAVLTTLAAQSRPADAVIGVDTGSTDASVISLRAALGSDRVIAVNNESFGHAVRAGVERVGRVQVTEGEGVAELIQWIWLLHDDSAPDPTCLEALLSTADDHPSASILGPKILGWHDRRLLLEVGVSITGAGRRYTGLERGEHDQGQHDGVRDVMSVSSAGMLVRRDVWELLQGFDPVIPLFRDDLDFCWRAHRAGERVIIATDAVIHHREASAHGRRERVGSEDAHQRPHRQDREAAAHVLLAQSGRLAGIFVAIRLLLGSALHAIAYVLGKDFKAARDEVGAVLDVALHPGRLVFSRDLNANTADEPVSVVRSLRPSTASQLRQVFDTVTGIATTSGAAAQMSVSAVETGPVDDDADYLDTGSTGLLRRLLLRPGVLLFGGLLIFAIAATRGLWLGDGVLQGGALLPSPAGAGDLWEQYTQPWHDVVTGSATPGAPYLLTVFALAAVLLGKAPVAVTVIMLLSIPIAGWSAYFALRGLVDSRAIRVWAGVAYALLPAVTGAISSGRIGTAIVAIALPYTVRSFMRICMPGGTTRRAAGTALLLSIVVAAAPGLWFIAVVIAVVVIVRTWSGVRGMWTDASRRVIIAVLGPLLILVPWSGYLLSHPLLFLFESGAVQVSPAGTQSATSLDVLLLNPGGVSSVPMWLTVGIVIAAFMSIWRREKSRQVLACWLIAAPALVLGIVQSVVMVTPPGSSTAVHPWAGPATLALGLAFIAAGAFAVDGLRERMTGVSFTIAQPVSVIVAVLAAAAPFLVAVTWFPNAEGQLHRASVSAVPAFVAADAVTAQAPRTLVLADDAAGGVAYELINGSGPVLGDADVSPDPGVLELLDADVADLASGRGGDEVTSLTGLGVRYVLLSKGSSTEIISVLDAEPGLRRLATSGGEVLWRIAGDTSRARLVAGDSSTPIGLADAETGSTHPYIDVTVPAGAGARSLVLGASADGGWRAVSVDPTTGAREQLEAAAAPAGLDWSQAFAAPGSALRVVVDYEGGPRARWLTAQLLIVLVFAVLALPSRRNSDIDLDADQADEQAGAA